MAVVEYVKEWSQDFLKIKTELQKAITVMSNIQYVGSSSIPGMKAKPIIDIDVGLESWEDFENVKSKLATDIIR